MSRFTIFDGYEDRNEFNTALDFDLVDRSRRYPVHVAHGYALPCLHLDLDCLLIKDLDVQLVSGHEIAAAPITMDTTAAPPAYLRCPQCESPLRRLAPELAPCGQMLTWLSRTRSLLQDLADLAGATRTRPSRRMHVLGSAYLRLAEFAVAESAAHFPGAAPQHLADAMTAQHAALHDAVARLDGTLDGTLDGAPEAGAVEVDDSLHHWAVVEADAYMPGYGNGVTRLESMFFHGAVATHVITGASGERQFVLRVPPACETDLGHVASYHFADEGYDAELVARAFEGYQYDFDPIEPSTWMRAFALAASTTT